MSVFPYGTAGPVGGTPVGTDGAPSAHTLRAHGFAIAVPAGWDVRIAAAAASGSARSSTTGPAGSATTPGRSATTGAGTAASASTGPVGPAGGSAGATGPVGAVGGSAGATSYPVVHAANFALPARRDSFGGTVVANMNKGQVFVALLDYGPNRAPGQGLFAPLGLPRQLDPDWFDPYQMQRAYPAMAGVQRFFTDQGHKYCLYAAIGSYSRRQQLVATINDYLKGVVLQPSAQATTGAP